MTVKEYLNQARTLDKEIDAKLDHLAKIESMVNKVTSTISDMPGNPSQDNSKRERYLVKMIDLKWKINAEIDELVDTKREIVRFISKIDNSSYRLLLELRYVNLCTWEKIAEIMEIGVRHVYRMHGAALVEADRMWKEI